MRELVELAFQEIGIEIAWRGKGIGEIGFVNRMRHKKLKNLNDRAGIKEGDVVVEVDPRYFRPTEVDNLLGDSSKAKMCLGWEPEISFSDMVAQMVMEDIEEAEKDQLCKESGFKVLNHSSE